MTLTPADLERIEALLKSYEATFLGDNRKHVGNRQRKLMDALFQHRAALIALARRASELESALAFLQQQPDRELARHGAVGFEVGTLGHITTAARELGWPGLQSEGGKEQDG